MTDRRGQTWRFGDEESGYIFTVLETDELGRHSVVVLDTIGGWSSMFRPGARAVVFELKAWEEDAGFRRIT